VVPTLDIRAGFPRTEVREALGEVVRNQMARARARFARFQSECQALEKANGMSSQGSLERFEAGELGDAQEWFDWFAAKQGRDIWARKLLILSELALWMHKTTTGTPCRP